MFQTKEKERILYGIESSRLKLKTNIFCDSFSKNVFQSRQIYRIHAILRHRIFCCLGNLWYKIRSRIKKKVGKMFWNHSGKWMLNMGTGMNGTRNVVRAKIVWFPPPPPYIVVKNWAYKIKKWKNSINFEIIDKNILFLRLICIKIRKWHHFLEAKKNWLIVS